MHTVLLATIYFHIFIIFILVLDLTTSILCFFGSSEIRTHIQVRVCLAIELAQAERQAETTWAFLKASRLPRRLLYILAFYQVFPT